MPQQVEVALGGPHDVAVGEHDALGRPGGARRVDDRGQRVGGDEAGRLRQVGGVALGEYRPGHHALAAGRAGDDLGARQGDDAGQLGQLVAHDGEALEEAGVLDHGHLGVAVAGQVGDLVGGDEL